uniref:Uncharacterized protein n=1 Tax=Chenopodium quinoa TaxID=63459 RepID=A0A803M1W0_CHEQI
MSSAPLEIPDWSKIYGVTSKKKKNGGSASSWVDYNAVNHQGYYAYIVVVPLHSWLKAFKPLEGHTGLQRNAEVMEEFGGQEEDDELTDYEN